MSTPASKIPLSSRIARFFARALPLGYFEKLPTIIIIDVTNSCNLRCPVCPVTISMHRKRGLMSLDIFRRIIDDFTAIAAKPSIYFNFSGEPTLNDALPELISYAHKHGHDTFLSTNATKLDQDMCERLVRSGLDRVNLCMDGFSKEAQESYRVRSDFDEVKGNIERFLAARSACKSKTPKCVLQTLLTSYSEDQMEAMTKWADAIGFDRVRFKTFSIGSYTTEEEKREYSRFLPTKPELRRHPSGIERALCTTPLYQTVVFWNGDLGLCCIDYDQMVQLPNIEKTGFLKAYLSKPALKARRKGYLKQFEICQGCSYSNAENLGFRINLNQRRREAKNRKKAA